MHGGIIDNADVVLLAEWQNRRLDRAIQHGVGRLVRGNGGNLHDTLHLFHAEVRDANPTNLALLLQVGHHTPGLFDLLIRFRPVHLVEVDGIHREATKAVFRFAANVLQAIGDFALLIPHQAALGEDVWLVRSRLECACDDLLGMSQAIHGRGVNPVDAEFKRFMNRGDGIVIVLGSPGKLPVATADCPGTEPDGCEFHIRVTKLLFVHALILRFHLHVADLLFLVPLVAVQNAAEDYTGAVKGRAPASC